MEEDPGPFDHDETSRNSHFSQYQNNGVQYKFYLISLDHIYTFMEFRLALQFENQNQTDVSECNILKRF